MAHYLSLVVLLALFWSVTSDFNTDEEQMKGIRARFCGDNLRTTLSNLCQGIYNAGRKKKSMYYYNTNPDYDYVEPLEHSRDVMLKFPFSSKERAMSIIPLEFRKRKTHGITEECCHKTCTLFELSFYCGGSTTSN